MYHNGPTLPLCPIHGHPAKRSTCRSCNAAYMRHYMRQRRLETPGRVLWERAKRRAQQFNLPFSISPNDISLPSACPALGIRIRIGRRRSNASPSLDRIVPSRGYVPGNIRVISDRANRLKSDKSLAELRKQAAKAAPPLNEEYERIATYVDRESLLAEVWAKAMKGGREGAEWEKIARFLDRAFNCGNS